MFGKGPNIGFYLDYSNKNCSSYFGQSGYISYEDSLGKGKSIFTGDLNNSNMHFKMKEIEVFKLFK